MTSEMIDGEISLGHGWWLRLPQAFVLNYGPDGAILLDRPTMRIAPEVISFDAASLTEPVDVIVREIIADTIGDDAAHTEDLGRLTGDGWAGYASEGGADPQTGERQLLAALGAAGTILNLTVRFHGDHDSDEARWVAEHVLLRPETAELTTVLARADTRLVVPSGSMDDPLS